MVAKRTRVWKHPDTGVVKLPKVVDAQGTLRHPALYIWQNIVQTTTTTGPQDTDFERILTTSRLHIGNFLPRKISPHGLPCGAREIWEKSGNDSALDNCGKVLDHCRTFHAPDPRAGLSWRGQMKRKAGTPRIYLASSGMGNMPVANVEERLLSLLATLEECREFLMDKASPETARLLSLAILELRMELHQVTDFELKALCELMEAEERKPQESNSGRPLPPYLKLIK
jgi:hypothetical protein